jgi:gluconolactonase
VIDCIETLVEGVDHSEGVAWGKDGFLYCGGEEGQIYRASLDGSFEEIARGAGEMLGVAVDGNEKVYACDTGRGAVIRVDPATGSIDEYSSIPMVLPNYLCFDDAGNLYVTDSGDYMEHNGSILKVDPHGETRTWETTLGRYPNGCCLDAPGEYLYVVESYRPGISRVPVHADGSAGEPELVIEIPRTVPDGIAFDSAGRLYISCWRPDRIYRLDPDGKLHLFADDPHAAVINSPTNVAFIGEDLTRMAIANVGEQSIGVVTVDTPGLPLRYPEL